jgi:shikimate dehydrogenase
MKVLGVVGWPISHSKSPAMHNAALRHLGLDYIYLPFAVQDLATAIAGARALGFRGLNVTIPHKEAALALCQPDELARSVGAVNTLIFDEGTIRGTNTDVFGFQKLMEETGISSPKKVIILGAGGAARAVLAALPDAIVVARNPRGLKVEPWDSLPLHLPDADLLVDCTPRGLTSEKESLDLTNTRASVLDLVVRRETALTREAKRLGLPTATGTAMLLHQGAAALEQWIGRPAPLEIMRKALDAALD